VDVTRVLRLHVHVDRIALHGVPSIERVAVASAIRRDVLEHLDGREITDRAADARERIADRIGAAVARAVAEACR
jgi:hypothetical protein